MNVIVDDLAVHYLDQGSGTVILLLHGWQDAAKNSLQFIQKLSKKHRVVAPDLPGFGSTEMPPKAWFIQDYAEFVRAFCQKLDIKPNLIIGHSMGARIAIRLAASNLLPAGRIVLISAAGISQSKSMRVRTFNSIAKTGKFVTSLPGLVKAQKSLQHRFRRTVGASDYETAGALRPTLLNILQEDLQGDAAKITWPTLLIYGENDQDTPLTYARRLHNLIKKSKLVILSDAGHFVHLEQTDKVIRAIEEFAS